MYRFKLEPYKGIATRHTCPSCNQNKCFSRYIDIENRIVFPTNIGRCNREKKCGYHCTPKLYFSENGDEKGEHNTHIVSRSSLIPTPISYIESQYMMQSLKQYNKNKLFQFMASRFGEQQTQELMLRYYVGTANYWQGATVFWQVDIKGKIRTGKIMLYESSIGRRIKTPHNHITWVHTVLCKKEFNLKQCFFGEHLLSTEKTKPIAIVESEKSALIASHYLPHYLWIATGGKNGCFNLESLQVLSGRKIVLFPDLGVTDEWRNKIKQMKSLNIDVRVFDYLEKNATEQQKEEGFDIADFLLEIK